MNEIDMAFLSGNNNTHRKAPLGLTIAAIYLIAAAVLGFIYFISKGVQSEVFQQKSVAYQAGLFTRQIIISILFFVSGIGILKNKSWARSIAIWTIPIATIFSIFEFAWGWSRSNPTIIGLLIALIFTGGWNGIWFYLVFRKSSKDYLLSTPIPNSLQQT